MDSVNLTFHAFLHRKFSSMYIMVPGGSKRGSVHLWFGRQGGAGPPGGLRGSRGSAH